MEVWMEVGISAPTSLLCDHYGWQWVGIVLIVGTVALPRIAPAASRQGLRGGDRLPDLSLRQNESL